MTTFILKPVNEEVSHAARFDRLGTELDELKAGFAFVATRRHGPWIHLSLTAKQLLQQSPAEVMTYRRTSYRTVTALTNRWNWSQR